MFCVPASEKVNVAYMQTQFMFHLNSNSIEFQFG